MTRQRRILMMAFVALLPLLISTAQGQDDRIGANKIEGYAFNRGDELWCSEGGANLSWMERGGNPAFFSWAKMRMKTKPGTTSPPNRGLVTGLLVSEMY